MVRADRRLANLLLSRAFSAGWLVILPFMGIHALNALGEPDSFLGILVIVQMVGGIGGNVVGSFIGDWWSSRTVVLLAGVFSLLLCIGLMVASSVPHFLALFAFFGATNAFIRMGQTTLPLEICPLQRRVSYMTMFNMVGVFASLAAGGAASVIRSHSLSISSLAVPAAVLIVVSLVFVLRVADPRRDPPPADL